MSENGVCVCVRWRKKEVKIRGDLRGEVDVKREEMRRMVMIMMIMIMMIISCGGDH